MNQTGQYLNGRSKALSIYFTADYPYRGSTTELILALQDAGVDLIEVGIPFSDPLADGLVIQQSSQKALEYGFQLNQLFEDLERIKSEVKIPLVLMGYFNTVLSFGLTKFLMQCKSLSIDTVILPDLPPDIYQEVYQSVFEAYEVSPVFLITPQTSNERMAYINQLSNAFIYAVASNSITGGNNDISKAQLDYFIRLQAIPFKVPLMIGFGISNNKAYTQACEYAKGAIIGSAFIKALADSTDLRLTTIQFIKDIHTESI